MPTMVSMPSRIMGCTVTPAISPRLPIPTSFASMAANASRTSRRAAQVEPHAAHVALVRDRVARELDRDREAERSAATAASSALRANATAGVAMRHAASSAFTSSG